MFRGSIRTLQTAFLDFAFCFLLLLSGFNSLVGGIMGFTILISAQVFKDHPDVWFLDGLIGVLIGLIILAYGLK